MYKNCPKPIFDTNAFYVLGFMRDTNGVMDYGFVAEFKDNQIKNITAVSEKEYDFYHSYKHLEIMGFTKKVYEGTSIDCELDKLKSMNHTLSNFYAHHHT